MGEVPRKNNRQTRAGGIKCGVLWSGFTRRKKTINPLILTGRDNKKLSL
jgi:hypothetical protein